MKFRKFVDIVTVYARAGCGGDGCCSFRREKYIPRGGPDGGDGGRGGHVVLRADPNENSLIRMFYSPHQRAQDGEHGKGKQMYGRNGADLVVPVPLGTIAVDKETETVLGQILAQGDELRVARGGCGGRGNCHFTTSTHRAPREHTLGEPGEEIILRLELKLLADIGLVGFPNAGKSSLLSRISDAHPKIAPYPFTTLNPIVGTIIGDDYTSLTVADVPGLLPGSHAGVGLGHAFLRHIERSTVLVYVLDMAGTEGRSPAEDYRILREELTKHDEALPDRQSLIVANKMDLPSAGANCTEFTEATGIKPIRISALTGEGIPELKKAMFRLWGKRARKGRIRKPSNPPHG